MNWWNFNAVEDYLVPSVDTDGNPIDYSQQYFLMWDLSFVPANIDSVINYLLPEMEVEDDNKEGVINELKEECKYAVAGRYIEELGQWQFYHYDADELIEFTKDDELSPESQEKLQNRVIEFYA